MDRQAIKIYNRLGKREASRQAHLFGSVIINTNGNKMTKSFTTIQIRKTYSPLPSTSATYTSNPQTSGPSYGAPEPRVSDRWFPASHQSCCTWIDGNEARSQAQKAPEKLVLYDQYLVHHSHLDDRSRKPYVTEYQTLHACWNCKGTMNMCKEANLRHNYDNRPYTSQSCRDQNHAGLQ